MAAKKEVTSTTMADDMMHIDMSKLESAWGKDSAASKNMLEMMQSQLAFKQMRLLNQDMDTEESRKRLEEVRLSQVYI